MDIQWHGLSCFTLKGKSATVVIDPYTREHAGIKPPTFSADIALSNSESELHHGIEQFDKTVRIFDWPGEYEAKNVIVQAISAYDRPREKDENEQSGAAQPVLIYTLVLDGFKICHLSNLGHKLTTEMLEAIGDVDILIIPVGGTNCLDAKKAHEVVEQIDPRIVIPMYYKIDGLKMALTEVEPFLKEVGAQGVEREKWIKYQSPSQLPQDKMEFKVLEPVLG